MKVVILAGGLGDRIDDKSIEKPKPLFEIGNRPILWHIMKIYSYFGFNDFIICLGENGALIKDYFYNLYIIENDIRINYGEKIEIETLSKNREPWKVTLVDTGVNTMTGGRLKRIESYIDDDIFLFTYGNEIGDININKVIKYHMESNDIVTLTAVNPKGILGIMDIEGNKVKNFKDKEVNDNLWVNAGFFVASKKIFNYIQGDNTSIEEFTLKKLAKEGNLGVYKHYGFWKKLDTIKAQNDLNEMWNAHKAPWNLWS